MHYSYHQSQKKRKKSTGLKEYMKTERLNTSQIGQNTQTYRFKKLSKPRQNMSLKKYMPGHIIIKLQKVKTKNIESRKENDILSIRGTMIQMTVDFSLEITEANREIS